MVDDGSRPVVMGGKAQTAGRVIRGDVMDGEGGSVVTGRVTQPVGGGSDP